MCVCIYFLYVLEINGCCRCECGREKRKRLQRKTESGKFRFLMRMTYGGEPRIPPATIESKSHLFSISKQMDCLRTLWTKKGFDIITSSAFTNMHVMLLVRLIES